MVDTFLPNPWVILRSWRRRAEGMMFLLWCFSRSAPLRTANNQRINYQSPSGSHISLIKFELHLQSFCIYQEQKPEKRGILTLRDKTSLISPAGKVQTSPLVCREIPGYLSSTICCFTVFLRGIKTFLHLTQFLSPSSCSSCHQSCVSLPPTWR